MLDWLRTNAKALTSAEQRRLRREVERPDHPLRSIVERRLDRMAESDPKFDPADMGVEHKREFAKYCLQELRKSDPRYRSIGLMILLWALQATVIHFVMQWWKRREERNKPT